MTADEHTTTTDRDRTRWLRRAALPLAATAMLAAAAPAMAQDPSVDAYANDGGDVLSTTDSSGSTTSGNLPFTGFDALAIAGGGAVLVLLGGTLRWVARRDRHEGSTPTSA